MKKFLCLMLSIVMVLGCTITVYATEVNVPATGEVTGSTPSSFTVDDSMIPDGVVLRIPATLNPVYDANIDAYTVKDVVSVTGGILDTQEVSVSVNSEITYQLADSEETATGYVKFGNNGVETWNASEVALGATDLAQADTRNIIVNIPSNSYGVAGSYTGTCEFDVNVGTLGLYGNICPPTVWSDVFTVTNRDWSSSSTVCVVPENSINTNNVGALNLATNNAFKAKDFYFWYNRESADLTYPTVKWIEMSDDSRILGYSTQVGSTVADTKSWLHGYTGLQVLVVPEAIDPLKLGGSYSSMYKWTHGDYTNTCFAGTDTVIGNALVFMKDITDDNDLFVYVPHIVYRGTMEQWKALSGSTDWVFGNAANVVQVHCTDGDLIY